MTCHFETPLQELREIYQSLPCRKDRKLMLDALEAETGLNRTYLARLLRGDADRIPPEEWLPQGKPLTYDQLRLDAIFFVWVKIRRPGPRRLKAELPRCLPHLHKHGYHLTEAEMWQAQAIGWRQLERRMAPGKAAMKGEPNKDKERSDNARMRQWLLSVITAREFAGYPGAVVAFDMLPCGGRRNVGGFISILVGTDPATGMMRIRAVPNLRPEWMVPAIKSAVLGFPHSIVRVLTDNGGEFHSSFAVELFRELGIIQRRITPHCPNENAHVEERNGFLRQWFPKDWRLDTPEQLAVLTEDVLPLLEFYLNAFCATQRLVAVRRRGRKRIVAHGEPLPPVEHAVSIYRERGWEVPEGVNALLLRGEDADPLQICSDIDSGLAKLRVLPCTAAA